MLDVQSFSMIHNLYPNKEIKKAKVLKPFSTPYVSRVPELFPIKKGIVKGDKIFSRLFLTNPIVSLRTI